MTHCLFVYGTLKRTGNRSTFLQAFRHRPARAIGRLYDLPAGYPALGPGKETVFGELYEGLPESLLTVLDTYEGISEGLFRRREVAVRVDTERIQAWVYWMDDPKARGGWHLKTGRYQPVRRR